MFSGDASPNESEQCCKDRSDISCNNRIVSINSRSTSFITTNCCACLSSSCFCGCLQSVLLFAWIRLLEVGVSSDLLFELPIAFYFIGWRKKLFVDIYCTHASLDRVK